jgi:hypothetical protein
MSVRHHDGKPVVIITGKVKGELATCPYCNERAIVREWVEAFLGAGMLVIMFYILFYVL